MAQLIQQTLEQERWQREMMEQRYKQYMDDDEEVAERQAACKKNKKKQQPLKHVSKNRQILLAFISVFIKLALSQLFKKKKVHCQLFFMWLLQLHVTAENQKCPFSVCLC